jgi:hypothetical protein
MMKEMKTENKQNTTAETETETRSVNEIGERRRMRREEKEVPPLWTVTVGDLEATTTGDLDFVEGCLLGVRNFSWFRVEMRRQLRDGDCSSLIPLAACFGCGEPSREL